MVRWPNRTSWSLQGEPWDGLDNVYPNDPNGDDTYGYLGNWCCHPERRCRHQVSNLTAIATGPNGAVVNYPSTFTTGGASPTPRGSTTRSRPPRGPRQSSRPPAATFPIGTTVVTATATDADGRTSTATFDVTVLPPSAIALTSSAPSSVAEQPVTLTATLNEPGPAGVTPTGKVTFMDGSTVIGAGTLKTTGGVTTASFTTSALAPGSHTITGVYGGDSNFAPLTSAVLSQSVAKTRRRLP